MFPFLHLREGRLRDRTDETAGAEANDNHDIAEEAADSSLHAMLTRVPADTQASQAAEAQSPLRKRVAGGAKIVSKKRRR